MQSSSEDLDAFLRTATAFVAIAAFIIPVLGGWGLWRLSKTFATRRQLRALARRMKLDMHNEITRIEEKNASRSQQILEAIERSSLQTRSDLNGLGERITGVLRIAEVATERADEADHKVALLHQQVTGIDQYGTQAMQALMTQVNALASHLQTLNAVLEAKGVTLHHEND